MPEPLVAPEALPVAALVPVLPETVPLSVDPLPPPLAEPLPALPVDTLPALAVEPLPVPLPDMAEPVVEPPLLQPEASATKAKPQR
jgi:hypothetical protein